MRTFRYIAAPLGLIGALIGCDALWSSSAVDCGRSGFKCPEGYTPPGQDSDMSMNGSDDGGGGGGDMGTTPGNDMAGLLPTYTSIYVLGDSQRSTFVGTETGDVRTYLADGSGVPGFTEKKTEDANHPIVGIWAGDIRRMDGSSTKRLTIYLPVDTKIISYVEGNANPSVRATTQMMRSLWVGAWNTTGVTIGGSNDYAKLFATGDAGYMQLGDILDDTTITWATATTVGTQTLRAVGGLAGISSYGINYTCMFSTTGPCVDGFAWAAGDAGSLYYFNKDQVWNSVGAFSGKPGATATYLGLGASPYEARVSVLGSNGVYAERSAGGVNNWRTLTPAPFGTTTMRSVCFFDSNDVWAVGDGGSIYRYLYDNTAGMYLWRKVTTLVAGKNYTGVNFQAVHCAPAAAGAQRRVSVVGSNSTFIYTDYNITLSDYGPWTAAVEP